MPNESLMLSKITREGAQSLLIQIRQAGQLAKKIDVVEKVLTNVDQILDKQHEINTASGKQIKSLRANQQSIFNGISTLNSRWENSTKTYKEYNQKTVSSLTGLINQDSDKPALTIEMLDKGQITVDQKSSQLTSQLTALAGNLKAYLDQSAVNTLKKMTIDAQTKTRSLFDRETKSYEAANAKLDQINDYLRHVQKIANQYDQLLTALEKKLAGVRLHLNKINERVAILLPVILPVSDQEVLAEFEASNSQVSASVKTHDAANPSKSNVDQSTDQHNSKVDQPTAEIDEKPKEASKREDQPKKKKHRFLFW